MKIGCWCEEVTVVEGVAYMSDSISPLSDWEEGEKTGK